MTLLRISPSHFDVIVIGNGLATSIIAAAAHNAGKSVLRLDSDHSGPFYGSDVSSLSLHDVTSFLNTSSSYQYDVTADVIIPQIYSDVEIKCYDESVLECSRKFRLDVSGPRVLFCADECVNLLLKSGGYRRVEFKNIDASFVRGESGKLVSTLDSKSAVFKDRTLKYSEKNQLNSFFKMAVGHKKGEKRIKDEDLERPFVTFLDDMNFPPEIKSMILYAIAMVDYDQDAGDSCKCILKTRDGIDRLALYQSSLDRVRFPAATGALLYPLYGQKALQNAFFSRHTYLLRGPVIPVLLDKDSETCKGVTLVSGQKITCDKLVMDASFTIPSPVNPPSEDVSNVFKVGGVSGKVARGICITNSSIKPNISSCLVIYPPRSLYPDQATSIRVLQLGSNIAVCPSGMFVVYFSALCDNALEGKKSLHAAMDSLFSVHTLDTADSSSTNQTDSAEVKPTLLWSALYIQDLIEGSMGPVVTTPTPDGNLNYNDLIGSTLKLLQKLYPDDDSYLFPGTRNRSCPRFRPSPRLCLVPDLCLDFCRKGSFNDKFSPETINTDTPTLRIKLDDDSDLLES